MASAYPDPMELIREVVADFDDPVSPEIRDQILNLDFAGDLEAWAQRAASWLRNEPPGGEFDHLQFVSILAPIVGDEEGAYTEVIIGSELDFDPLEEEGAAYGDYCPSPSLLDSYVPSLTTCLDFLDDHDGLSDLEMTFTQLGLERLAELIPDILLGDRPYRLLFVGFNEGLFLYGAITPEGLVIPEDEEDEADFIAALKKV